MHATQNLKVKKLYLSVSITFSLGTLAYFKYANFFLDSIAYLLEREHSSLEIILPVGISFFIFQAMSYTIDVYRNKIDVSHSITKYLLYIAFFPQLVAGPIVRASDFLPQLIQHLELKKENLIIGGQLFLGGAMQKVLIADNLSKFVDPVFSNPALYSSETLWLALVSYSIQIFCDFSGYSLMAIGVARMLGFKLPENFRMPYVSQSITEFWRRWHISLSSWLRDYLYISLGGNKKGVGRTYFNLIVTMLLGGLWHGASWNFVIWGGMHGVGLIVHKLWSQQTAHWEHIKTTVLYKAAAWFVTILYVMLLWVPFRSDHYSKTFDFFAGLLAINDGILWLHTSSMVLLGFVILWHLLYYYNHRYVFHFPTNNPLRFSALAVIGFSLFAILMFAPIETSPFIYFQF